MRKLNLLPNYQTIDIRIGVKRVFWLFIQKKFKFCVYHISQFQIHLEENSLPVYLCPTQSQTVSTLRVTSLGQDRLPSSITLLTRRSLQETTQANPFCLNQGLGSEAGEFAVTYSAGAAGTSRSPGRPHLHGMPLKQSSQLNSSSNS